MAKCKITVLIHSVAKNRICFNPLITIDEQATIAELQEKCLALYAKKAHASILQEDVLAITTQNAGVESSIADDSDAVLDVFGHEATVTVVVKDAADLLAQTSGLVKQLHTPVSSTAPSLDYGPVIEAKTTSGVTHNFAVPSADEFTFSKRQELLSEDTRSKKRKRSRRSGRMTLQDASSDSIQQQKSLLTRVAIDIEDNNDDDFQFTRPQSTMHASTNVQALMLARPANEESTTSAKLGQPGRESIEGGSKVVSAEPSSEGAKAPLTESNLQLVSSAKAIPEQKQNGDIISVLSSSIHSSHVLHSISNDNADTTASPLQIDAKNPDGLIATKAVPIEPAVGHGPGSSPQQSPKEAQLGESSTRGQASHAESDLISESALITSAADKTEAETESPMSATESELADFLSTHSGGSEEDATSPFSARTTEQSIEQDDLQMADAAAMTTKRDRKSASLESSADSDSDDSSSMESGHVEQDDSTGSSKSGDESESHIEQIVPDSQEDDKPKPSFSSISRNTPESSQMTAPLPDLDTDDQLAAPEESLNKVSTPSRPGLKSSYKSLSFLHDQALREKDDMTKLASPHKMSKLQAATSREETVSDIDAEEETDDSSSESSSEDDSQDNLPPNKRAKFNNKSSKKRQSQGAKAFMKGLL